MADRIRDSRVTTSRSAPGEAALLGGNRTPSLCLRSGRRHRVPKPLWPGHRPQPLVAMYASSDVGSGVAHSREYLTYATSEVTPTSAGDLGRSVRAASYS